MKMAILGKNIRFHTLILIFLTAFLSSCFDVIQDFTINENGSGSLRLTVNLSKSKMRVDNLLAQDSIRGIKTPNQNQFNTALDNVEQSLQQSPGISNTSITRDFKQHVYVLQFNFSTIEALNNVQKELQSVSPSLANAMHFELENDSFTCDYSKPLLSKTNQQLLKYKLGDLKAAELVTILRFQKDLKDCNLETGHISKNGKSILTKVKASDFIEKTANQTIIVNFKE